MSNRDCELGHLKKCGSYNDLASNTRQVLIWTTESLVWRIERESPVMSWHFGVIDPVWQQKYWPELFYVTASDNNLTWIKYNQLNP